MKTRFCASSRRRYCSPVAVIGLVLLEPIELLVFDRVEGPPVADGFTCFAALRGLELYSL